MHKKLTNRHVAAALASLMCVSFLGMWGIYLFVGNTECIEPCEYAKELFIYAIKPAHEGALLFQASLASIVICAAIAAMALYSKHIMPVLVLGASHAVASLYFYTWDNGILAVAVVLPLLMELKNA